jgi:hypothetical protein
MLEIRTTKTDCNAVIKNLDKSVTIKTLEKFCSQFGKIISSKIAMNEHG